MKIENAVCYSYSLYGEDPLAHLRLIGPLRSSGINIVNGIENNQINFERVSDGDIVIIQREIPQEFDNYKKIIESSHKVGKPVVFDLDDLLLCLPENHPDRQSTVFGPSLLPMFQMLLEADLVSVSTPKLKDFVLDYNNNVAVLPNYFDDNLWHLNPPIPKESEREALTIGYMGGNSHKPDLEFITPVLMDLIRRYPQKIRFQFWGVHPPFEIASLAQVEWTPVRPSSYKDFSAFFQTQTADIFIAPLFDNLFNRCKSPIKFFEYSALGVPGVFSCLETYTEVITHGHNGLLASSLDEWTDCLIQLIEDEKLRLFIAKNAQETIQSNWLLSKNAFHWKETFQGALDIPSSQREHNSRIVGIVNTINSQIFETFNKRSAILAEKEGAIQTLISQVAAREQTLQVLSAQLTEREQFVQTLSVQLAEKEQSVQALSLLSSEKERAAAVLAAQVTVLTAQVTVLTAQVTGIYSSNSWRLIQVLWKIRTIFIPHGSRRERWLHLAVRGVFFFKHYGVRSFIRRAVERLRRKGVAPLINLQPDPVTIVAQDGTLCPMPAISIVIEKNLELNLPSVRESEVLAWVAAQTFRGIEVLVWESDTGKTITLGDPIRTWNAPNLEELCCSLTGRYLCMASPDLLQRNRSYLENNLIALESEDLAFTVNALGKSDWLHDPLSRGYLPGGRMLPYLRQVIRRECARNDFSMDIKSCLREQPEKPTIAGKIIVTTTAFPDPDNPFPAETQLADTVEWKLKGNYIIARRNSQIPWEPLTHIVHPVNTVIPVLLEPSNLPTVIVFMPFLAVGGAERLALQLIHYLQDQVRFIVVTVEGMDAALGTTADAFHQMVPFVYTVADYLLPPLNFSFLSYLIERFQADTFYIANGSNFIYDAMGTLRQRYPDLRIVNQVYDHQFGWIDRYDPTVAASIDAHISANPNITQAYSDRGVRPERIYFVEHAVNMDDINPADYPVERCNQIKQKLGLPAEKKLVTFCARMHPQKRPLDFIELVRRFNGEKDIHFLMVGDGPLTSAVEEQVRRTGLKNFSRCKFYSPISDIYAITDVMVLPSEYEAMPLVILETLAMGKPVVATDVGHIRDVVEMTHGGVVVPNIGDVAALRMGVLQALHEPVDSVTMRKIIDQRFGLSHIARQYLQVWLGEPHA